MALHNLPVELSSFVGRTQELGELEKILRSTRLLTLTNIGGAGKTRLALKLAAAVASDYPEGVFLVALGPVLDEGLLSQTVASVLDVRERSGESLDDSLCRHLRDRKALLLLDGCEHLVDACARLVEHILGSGRALSVLTTSQEALRVPGEVTWRVPSLSLPSEAVRLFAERAALVQPGFALNGQNGPGVERICRRLDGLPLAIELAAGTPNTSGSWPANPMGRCSGLTRASGSIGWNRNRTISAPPSPGRWRTSPNWRSGSLRRSGRSGTCGGR